MIFSEVEAFTSLVERFLKRNKKEDDNEERVSTKKDADNEELISTRFIDICKAHGVHRNQIPRVFENGLSLYDVQSDQHLLKKLDEQIITKACSLFGVEREWLDGVNSQVYPTYDFYGDPSGFKSFLSNLKQKSTGEIHGVLLSPQKNNNRDAALLLLQETVGYIGDSPIHRYYICNNWAFSYWKSRVYLASCVSQCWLNKVYIRGKSVPNEFINSIESGQNILDFRSNGIYCVHGLPWYAEDLASLPETFLKDVDPEMDNFGFKSGLKLWLELESDGLMNSSVQDHNAKERFTKELKKYT